MSYMPGGSLPAPRSQHCNLSFGAQPIRSGLGVINHHSAAAAIQRAIDRRKISEAIDSDPL